MFYFDVRFYAPKSFSGRFALAFKYVLSDSRFRLEYAVKQFFFFKPHFNGEKTFGVERTRLCVKFNSRHGIIDTAYDFVGIFENPFQYVFVHRSVNIGKRGNFGRTSV